MDSNTSRISKRTRRTIIVLGLFIVLALFSSLLYRTGNLDPEQLKQDYQEVISE